MTKKWTKGMTAEEVVDMPGEFVLLGTYTATRASDKAPYRVEVFTCGEYGGSIHFVDNKPRVRNVSKQRPLDTLRLEARHWDLLKAFKNVACLGIMEDFDEEINLA